MAKTIERTIRNKIRHIQDGQYDSKLTTSLATILQGYDVMIYSRVKAISSALEKYERKKYKSVKQIEDLLGIMIIVSNNQSVYKVAGIIKQNFKVLKEEDYIKNPKAYGYQSYHMIIVFHDITAEIQLKSEKQKLASDMTHELYKNQKFNVLKTLFHAVL